ncbi:uncharacterized protein LOC123451852 [Hordeum vulgare subsp. vulgare]|uniref:DUF4220 domain-containing protein n=1 Tax=Hordeum vulgare subsp. vulgare TaxID=112509 RepID=A0A8I6YUF9_HORVV|nr:uncharacterized protein LOC123451852 [Hordeum vulgare subsp. vulgare]KAI4989599.1 hypothetical protein ZWY2020_036916 [Hordeum vulgare]
MVLSSAVEWWQEWQLRILVLTSLFIQYILLFSHYARRVPILRRYRVLVWIAYVSSDAVAIFALATLFNRRRQTCDEERSNNLEVLWVPLLLIHLGGQPGISAYSLEDNELWKRHIVTLVSQITVAVYVFCRWWSGEKTQLAAAVLLFILGVLRFAQKPWALKTASFNSLQSSTVPLTSAQREYTREEYVEAAKRCVLNTKIHIEYKHDMDFMFLDQSAPYSVRIEELTSFLKLEYKHAYKKLQEKLGDTFDDMYTRNGLIGTGLGTGSFLLLPFLALASIVLFAKSRKDGQDEKDIWVTYILLCCTTVLELYVPFLAFSMILVPRIFHFLDDPICGWHNMVSQHNIMSLCVRKKKPTFLMKLATFDFLRELLNQHWYIQQVPTAYHISETVRRHMEDGWKKCICDAASYKSFSALRGQLALRMHHQLAWTLKMPLDESVLVWHVATELCFYHPDTSPQRRQEATQGSRSISNYMFYLLLIRPEMLMLGTRSALAKLATDQIFENSKGPLDMTEENLAQEILNMPRLTLADDMISNASKLAKALMDLGSEEERWTVIQGVWVEMLCYSASRCRGYLHAKSLGEGGEFLSYIYLLWSFMGLETLADRHHMSEHLTFHSQGRDDQSAEGDMPPV